MTKKADRADLHPARRCASSTAAWRRSLSTRARHQWTLWSAHCLEDAPEKVVAVHRAYIEAGADCILTRAIRFPRMGYAEFGFAPERADAALLKSVALARGAAAVGGVSRAARGGWLIRSVRTARRCITARNTTGTTKLGFDELVRVSSCADSGVGECRGAQRPDLRL